MAGALVDGGSSGAARISVGAQDRRRELGVGVGDEIVWDVQGVAAAITG